MVPLAIHSLLRVRQAKRQWNYFVSAIGAIKEKNIVQMTLLAILSAIGAIHWRPWAALFGANGQR